MPPTLSRRRALQLAGTTTAAGLVAPTAHAAPAAPAAPAEATRSGTTAGTAQAITNEADIAKALTWWPPQRQVWTPHGWKDHLFRFEVFYDGSLLFHPTLAASPTVGPRPYLARDYAGKLWIYPHNGSSTANPWTAPRIDAGSGWDVASALLL